jgi:hypothetical protein
MSDEPKSDPEFDLGAVFSGVAVLSPIDVQEVLRTARPLAEASIPIDAATSNFLNRWKTMRASPREAGPNMQNVPSATVRRPTKSG